MSWLDSFNSGIERGFKKIVDGVTAALDVGLRGIGKLLAVAGATLAVIGAIVGGVMLVVYVSHAQPPAGASGLLAIAFAVFMLLVSMAVAIFAWNWLIPGVGDGIDKWRYILPGVYAIVLLLIYYL